MNVELARALQAQHDKGEEKRRKAQARIDAKNQKNAEKRMRQEAKQEFETNFPNKVNEVIAKNSPYVDYSSSEWYYLEQLKTLAEKAGFKARTEKDCDGLATGETTYYLRISWGID